MEVPRIEYDKLADRRLGEPSARVRDRVQEGRQRQRQRFRDNGALLNSDMGPAEIREHCRLDDAGERLLKAAVQQLQLSARAYHRVLKLARTVADLAGADHIDTYPDVLNGIKALGYDDSKVDVLVYQFVSIVKDGKPYKMSTRKANFVTLDELMDEVGSDVTRFFFLMRSPTTHLEFDIAQAKEAGEKNPVFYLQYAHARIQSILRKVDDVGQLAGSADLELLTHESEIRLIKAMLEFPEIIQAAAQNKEPHRVINFLNSLASDFTTFYHDCRILEEDEKLMHARATLANAVAQVLANGLGILGISAPDRM
jgi:arginyl-tRNA synthetase